MSKYTTGELAKLCEVSVRTVQYYDTRGLLVPSELSEGGRRLYSENDLARLKIICYLRELELPIDSIKQLFREEQPEEVIVLLLQEQEASLRREIAQKQARADRLALTRRALGLMSQVSVESIGDIAHVMENRKLLWRTRWIILGVGLFMDVIEVTTLLLWILKGIWLPFALGMLLVIGLGLWVSWYYWSRVAYICPHCHGVFQPGLREAVFARHTLNTRRLTCPHCGHHGFCVETYGADGDCG